MAAETREDRREVNADHAAEETPLDYEGRPVITADQVFGYVLSLVILVVTAPLLALAAFAVRLTSRGPVIYTQRRLGRYGRPFTIYKLRTMHDKCEGATGPLWSTPGDPRITPVGRVLRATHLDELPQLWNVLRGEMSLVGPRPERPEIAAELEAALPRYADRTMILPGLTGLAQVQLPPDTDLESVRRKLVCDLHYVERQNPWLDLRILVATATGIVGVPFALPSRYLGLPSLEQIERANATFEAPPERGGDFRVRGDEVPTVLPSPQSQMA